MHNRRSMDNWGGMDNWGSNSNWCSMGKSNRCCINNSRSGGIDTPYKTMSKK